MEKIKFFPETDTNVIEIAGDSSASNTSEDEHAVNEVENPYAGYQQLPAGDIPHSGNSGNFGAGGSDQQLNNNSFPVDNSILKDFHEVCLFVKV